MVAAFAGGLAALAIAGGTPTASAQGWPERPVRMIVPAPPGGSLDIVGRMLADTLQPLLGQSLVIDNKAGAAGMIGVNELLKAPRDGYTLMVHISGVAAEIPLLIKPPYDPFRDIRPLAELARSPLVLVAGPQVAGAGLREVVAQVKANPGRTSYASYSPGTISHTLGVELNRAAGIDLVHVGYKGSPPALQDLMGGNVQLMFDGPATSIPLIQSGRIRPLATTGARRLSALPEVPTFAELGYPGLTQVAWIGLWATPDVPADVQARLRELVQKALAQPTLRDRLAGLGLEPGQSVDSDALSRGLKLAYDRQAALLKSIDFKSE
jgi:tripartite-type tricarboxylate transporter receptor subunit TctC